MASLGTRELGFWREEGNWERRRLCFRNQLDDGDCEGGRERSWVRSSASVEERSSM